MSNVDRNVFALAVSKASKAIGQAGTCRALANAIRKRNARDAGRLDRHALALEDAATVEVIEALNYGDARMGKRA